MRMQEEVHASESTPLVGTTRDPPTSSKWGFLPWRRQEEAANENGNGNSDKLVQAQGRVPARKSVLHNLSPAEVTNLMETFATEDKDEEKTWSRLFVERFLSKQHWYFPGKDVPNGPSLSKAWAFFEHMTLPRYEWRSADHMFRLADPGETTKTALYRPATMPESVFLEFGLGVDQYFSSLRMLSIMFLICFLINIPNMIYYASAEYSGEGGKSHLSWPLQVSAICTRNIWVVCKDCTPEEFSWFEEKSTYGVAPDGTVLVQRNNCGGYLLMDGAVDFVTFLFVSFFIIILCVYLHARETRFDEDRLTADDYSLIVFNPPSEAKDPDEWREFFQQFADKQVTMVTVALDNDDMLRKLKERRLQVAKLKSLLPDYIDVEDEAMVLATLSRMSAERQSANISWLGRLFEDILRSTGMLVSAEQAEQRLQALTNEIKELQKKKYNVSRVFVTFETEEGQRKALSSLSPPPTPARLKPVEPPTFRGKTLIVKRAADPSSVHWQDLSSRRTSTLIVMAINFAITLAAICFAAFCENLARKKVGPVYASPLVSVFNSAMPYLVEALMYYERHRTEDTWQVSYFTKITLFRWVNTSIIVKIFTPLTSNLGDDSNDVIPSMYYILISELLVTPMINFSDMSGNFYRHFAAPHARTQQEMNMKFIGTTYRLGERFTAMTNILFACFFYSAMFPAGFLLGFGILQVQYFIDKYSLVRTWKRAPAIGPNLARMSRRYFFSAAIVVFICSSAYAWAQFPYDNLCSKEGDNEVVTQQEFDNVRLLDGSVVNVTVSQERPVYFCSQDLQEFDVVFPFPPTPRIQPDGFTWMSNEQDEVCTIFGWTALAAVIGFVAYFMKEIRSYLSSFHRSTYEPQEAKSQHIDFSCIRRSDSYIPVIRDDTLPYPLLACNVDGIDKALIGWHDPNKSYDEHNLIFDVPYPGLHRRKKHSHINRSESGCRQIVNESLQRSAGLLPKVSKSFEEVEAIFSIVKHYPPDWQRRLQLERQMVGPSFSASGSFDSQAQSWAPLEPLC